MTPLTTTIFEVHKVISALTIPIPTLSQVKASLYAWKQPYHSRSDIHGHLSLPQLFFFFYQQLFIVCSTSKGRDQVPCTLREGTYFSTSSTQHIWELITIKICLCVHTFGSCCAGNLTTERWKANDTFGYQHRDGLCWSGGGGLMSECRTCCVSLIWFPTSGTKTTRKELADFLKPLLFKLSKQLPSFRKQILYRSHQCAVR